MKSAGVVDLVDGAGKVGSNVLERFVVHLIHRFDLQRLHEDLGFGVVVGISAPERAGLRPERSAPDGRGIGASLMQRVPFLRIDK